MENIENKDYGNNYYSKEYKEKLKKNKVFYLDRYFIRNNFINPINKRIDRNMKILDQTFGIFGNFVKHMKIKK